MRKLWTLILLVAFPCVMPAQEKSEPLPMPPLVSHDQPLSGYACVFTPQPVARSVPYWNVLAYAEYGTAKKRYWSKTLGTFRGTAAVTSQNSESAKSGGAIGVVSQNTRTPQGEKKCSEWRGAVYEMLKESRSK
jgi:hypothetical protein